MTGSHTYGQRTDDNPTGECSVCGDGRRGAPCLHHRYSAKQRRFIEAHLEAFTTAYLNPDKRTSSNELARLSRESVTCPPGHDCWCWCPREDAARGYPPCKSCLKLRANQKPQEAPEIGHTRAVNAPMPDATMLDVFAGLLTEPVR